MESKWIQFREVSAPGVTKRWEVVASESNTVIGRISWSNGWRRYVLQPGYPTEWEQDCLRDVAKFIERQTGAAQKREKFDPNSVNSARFEMRPNVYVSYAVLTHWLAGVYAAFCKLKSRNDLTDGVGFEPTVRYERTHTFQARLANAANEHRRSISAVTETLLRSLRSETRPKTAPSRIQNVYSAPPRTRDRLRAFRFSEQGSRDLERAIREELRHRPPFAFEVQEWR